jgi:hypothetical protein
MATRNTKLIKQIVKALGNIVTDESSAVRVLEHHYRHHLLVNVGGIEDIMRLAKELRLRIDNDEEAADVLDYIEGLQLCLININQVEEGVNDLLGEDRFIEP